MPIKRDNDSSTTDRVVNKTEDLFVCECGANTFTWKNCMLYCKCGRISGGPVSTSTPCEAPRQDDYCRG